MGIWALPDEDIADLRGGDSPGWENHRAGRSTAVGILGAGGGGPRWQGCGWGSRWRGGRRVWYEGTAKEPSARRLIYERK